MKSKDHIKSKADNVRSSLPEIVINQNENKNTKIDFDDNELEDCILYIPKAK